MRVISHTTVRREKTQIAYSSTICILPFTVFPSETSSKTFEFLGGNALLKFLQNFLYFISRKLLY